MTKFDIGYVWNYKVARVGSGGRESDFESSEISPARNALGDGECTLTGDSLMSMHA